MATADILKEIIKKKKERIIFAKQKMPEVELKAKLQDLRSSGRSFMEAIKRRRQISLIAEIKRQSPSRTIFRHDFNHQEIARIYQEAGVQAISVITEEDYFGGSLYHLSDISGLVKVPILRKDFIIEPYQVYESRLFGADAVLLIVAALTKPMLSELLDLSQQLGVDCLVEVNTERELKKILGLKGIDIIGINNRNLHTLEVDFKTTERLFPLIPKGKVIVVESGIKRHQDVLFLKILGVDAVLIGEAFLEADDIAKKISEIMGW